MSGNGKINVDKYGNVSFTIYYENKCVNKTPLGKINVNKKCIGNKDIKITINKNNNKISFVSNIKNLDYKISTHDDFIGEWIHEDYKDNIVLKRYNEGKNYIWFKDSEGNVSEVISFEVNCFTSTKSTYDKNVFYCSGSTIKLDNIDFLVIKDNNDSIKLMKYTPIDDILSQCTKEESEYCYYTKDKNNSYNWTNSYVNYFLNSEFIKKLSISTINNLVDEYICDDLDSICNEESCVGISKDYIDKNNYICNSYTKSRVRVISYDEFNYVYSKTSNKKVLNGNYWAINSFSKDNGSSIQYNQDFYVFEGLTNSKDIKPVITLHK